MPALSSFDYAILRVVPRVEREELVNAGVILFCLERDFLQARIELDATRLHALWPGTDVELVRQHLEAIPRLSLRERFHWLVSPRSTVIQVSPVHSGLCESPERALDDLVRRMVLIPR